MGAATVLPTAAQIAFYQFSRKGAPAPKLAAPLSELITDVTVQFSTPLLDEDGVVVTRAFLLGIRKANGWTETCYCAAGNLSADGLTATVVRGIDPGGLDYTVGSAAFADEHFQDEAIFCNISGTIMALLQGAIQGTIATGGAGITIGTDAAGTVTLYRSTGVGTKAGVFRWNTGNSKAEYSNDGSVWNSIDSVTASNLVVVTGSDTTPSNLNAKTGSGNGITRAVTNPGANEILTFSVNGTLATLISDVTASATEINQALDGISAAVTFTNLNTLTAGAASDAAALHTHSSIAAVSEQGILGEAVSGSDITNNLNLVYLDTTTGKWLKVTSVAATWYNRLGIVLTAGVLDTVVTILIKGPYTGKTFTAIAPTFTSALTGTDILIGQANSNSAAAILLDNSTGAECTLSGAGTISAMQTGTPAGAMLLYLVLEQQETANSPAAFKDTTANVVRGAIIAQTSIAQALFSGTYANIAFDFGASVKIPAGARVYLVVSKTGAISGANYYQIRSSSATKVLDQSTQTWSGTANAGNVTFTVTSTSPIGYAVKSYIGTNGSFGLTPSNAWSRVIGQVITTTRMYFDPDFKRESIDYIGGKLIDTGVATGYKQVTTNFCPSQLKVGVSVFFDATANIDGQYKGRVRGDVTGASTFFVEAAGASVEENYLVPAQLAGSTLSDIQLALTPNASGTGTGVQNKVYAVRLENGYYFYNGYPAGTTFISGNQAGFTNTNYSFEIESKI